MRPAPRGRREHRHVPGSPARLGGSALTADLPCPSAARPGDGRGHPRHLRAGANTVFLSLALAWAEVLGAFDLVVGVNALDYSGYPDCRPEFVEAFERLANLATKAGVEGGRFRVHAPLLELSKAEIITLGTSLGASTTP